MANTYQANYFTGQQLDEHMKKVLDKSFAGPGLSLDDEGSLHCVVPGYWSLAHTYTHLSNREVYVQALDLTTGQFTSEAHGLTTGENVFVVVDEPYHVLNPYDYLPGGLIIGAYNGLRSTTRYLVQVLDENNFSLKLSGATSTLTFTEVSTMDFSKFHFEVWRTADVIISDLPEMTEALIIVKGRIAAAHKYIVPDGWINNVSKQGYANFDNYSGSASQNGDTYLGYRAGWGGMYTKIEMKYIGPRHLLQYKEEDTLCFDESNKAWAYHNRTYSHRSMEQDSFHSISFTEGGLLFNGSTVEVYTK